MTEVKHTPAQPLTIVPLSSSLKHHSFLLVPKKSLT